MSKIERLHLSWGATSDWSAVRAKLKYLKVVLYANFADVEGDYNKIKKQLVRRGLTVECEPQKDGSKLLRLQIAEMAKDVK
jgi:hypothetical protein